LSFFDVTNDIIITHRINTQPATSIIYPAFRKNADVGNPFSSAFSKVSDSISFSENAASNRFGKMLNLNSDLKNVSRVLGSSNDSSGIKLTYYIT
jgi:hypothetical protein